MCLERQQRNPVPEPITLPSPALFDSGLVERWSRGGKKEEEGEKKREAGGGIRTLDPRFTRAVL
jgi:hypothetical protein